jgi:hypothetical protein
MDRGKSDRPPFRRIRADRFELHLSMKPTSLRATATGCGHRLPSASSQPDNQPDEPTVSVQLEGVAGGRVGRGQVLGWHVPRKRFAPNCGHRGRCSSNPQKAPDHCTSGSMEAFHSTLGSPDFYHSDSRLRLWSASEVEQYAGGVCYIFAATTTLD